MRLQQFFTVSSLTIFFFSSMVQAADIITGDVRITSEMYDSELELLSKQNQIKYLGTLANTGILINDLYSRKKLLIEVNKRKLSEDPLIKRKLERAREAVLVESLSEDIKSKLEYPDFELLAKQYYKLNKDKFKSKEQVQASHILLKTGEGIDAADQRKKIEDLLVKLNKGANFAELVKLHSDDTASIERDGSLGWFAHGRMVKPFEEAVFGLASVGDLSTIVETDYGFHIILLTGKKPVVAQSYEDVQQQLKHRLLLNYQKQELGRQLGELADHGGADANIEAMDKAYQAARLKYLKPN